VKKNSLLPSAKRAHSHRLPSKSPSGDRVINCEIVSGKIEFQNQTFTLRHVVLAQFGKIGSV
jgi:hypothetical protein